MSDNELEIFKKILISARDTTEKSIENLKELTKPISPDNAIGRLSRMETINEKSVNEEALRKAQLRLTQISSALVRIDNEEYGECLKCGEEISHKRLKVVPESTLCMDCLNRPAD